MDGCVNHPDRPADLVCMKYHLRFCERCAACRDPKLYCKHRTACPIWFVAKDGENGWGAGQAAGDDERKAANR